MLPINNPAELKKNKIHPSGHNQDIIRVIFIKISTHKGLFYALLYWTNSINKIVPTHTVAFFLNSYVSDFTDCLFEKMFL